MRHDTKSRTVRAFVALSVLFTSQVASADDEGWAPNEKFVVWVRAYYGSGDTSIRVDSETLGLGTLLDLEDHLGMDDSGTVPIIGFRWRVAEKHTLDLAYLELNRNGQLIIDEEIRWDDLVFPINLDVRSNFDSKTTRLAYRYSLVSDSSKEFAIGGGIHWTEIDAGISEASIGAGEVSSAAPLPSLTVTSAFRLSQKWTTDLLLEWFGLDFGTIAGELWHANARVKWQARKRLGFNLGYEYFQLDVRAGDADFAGLFEYTDHGPFLGLEFSF